MFVYTTKQQTIHPAKTNAYTNREGIGAFELSNWVTVT